MRDTSGKVILWTYSLRTHSFPGWVCWEIKSALDNRINPLFLQTTSMRISRVRTRAQVLSNITWQSHVTQGGVE